MRLKGKKIAILVESDFYEPKSRAATRRAKAAAGVAHRVSARGVVAE